MKGIIDIHNHILYGVDDGSKNIQESMEIIDREYKSGVRKIILTPHFQVGCFETGLLEIEEKYKKLTELSKQKFPDLDIFLGQEVMYTENIAGLIEEGFVNRMAGSKYVLVEFMIDVDFAELERCLKEILITGLVPIVAHCERYKCIQHSIAKVKHLVDLGAYMQVNADTVYSLSKRGFVNKLIDNDCLHFVGTDAHNTTTRTVHWDKCISYLERRYEDAYINWLLVENPQKVLEDKFI